MPGMPAAPELPDKFWDSLQYAVSQSAHLYPYLTLFTLCTFALIFITIPVAGCAYTVIRKEQIKFGYREKRDKANAALLKLGVKLPSSKRQQKKSRKP